MKIEELPETGETLAKVFPVSAARSDECGKLLERGADGVVSFLDATPLFSTTRKTIYSTTVIELSLTRIAVAIASTA